MAFAGANALGRDMVDEEESSMSQAFCPPVCFGYQHFLVEDDDTTLQERGIADNNLELI